MGAGLVILGGLLAMVAFLAMFDALRDPVSDVIDNLSTIGFLAFFVWMPAMGVALLADARQRPA